MHVELLTPKMARNSFGQMHPVEEEPFFANGGGQKEWIPRRIFSEVGRFIQCHELRPYAKIFPKLTGSHLRTCL